MSYRFFFCDPVASFGEDSAGRNQRRLIDHWGKPHLGVDVWQLGLSVFELLGTESGQPVSIEDLRSIEKSAQYFLDNFFEELNSMAGVRHISLVSSENHLPIELPIEWREATWSWQVATLAKFVRGVADVRRQDGSDAIDLPADESIQAMMLVAALHMLDDAVLGSLDGDAAGVTANVLDAAWLLEQVEAPGRIELAATALAIGIDRRRASERARTRHARDPKRQAREFVRECWLAWRRQPNQYQSAAAFSRAMLDKQPDLLKSEVVIARWVRAWDKVSRASKDVGSD